jgi:hypothetical protein
MVEPRSTPGVAAIRLVLAVTFAFGCLSAAAPSHLFAQQQDDSNEESRDNAQKKGNQGPSIIPIPIFITEPAIGYGLGAAIGYFHPRKGDDGPAHESASPAFTTGTPPGRTGKGKQQRPPTITGVAAAYTENGTWAAGIGHSASWRKDTIRYVGYVAWANIESTFYFGNVSTGFSLEGGLIGQEIKFRVGDSPFMLGAKWSYVDATGRFKIGEDRPIQFPENSVADSGLAFQALWDTRDNTMTPDRGQLFQILTWRYDEAIGGDYNYWKVGLKLNSFHRFNDFVLGLRLDADGVSGDPPLWGYPWITLRGIPALRFQNEKAGVIEAELRWKVFEKWAVLGFVGTGATRGNTILYKDVSGVTAGGVGGRWLFRPEDKLWVGVDIADGTEKTYLYIQVGHAW